MQSGGGTRVELVMADDPAADRRPQPDAGRQAAVDPRLWRRPCRSPNRPSSKPMSGWPPKASIHSRPRLRLLCRQPRRRRFRSRRSARGSIARSIRSGSRGNRSKPATACSSPAAAGCRPSWLPEEGLRRALRALSRAERAGPWPIMARRWACRRCASSSRGAWRERGIEAAPDQIMLTESGTQAIDLLCRFLIEPGDTVLVDDPCYFNFHALLRAHRAKIVGVPYTPPGPDIDAVRSRRSPSTGRGSTSPIRRIHNPTGATLSPVVAHRLLKLADQFELTIIEDDIFADFEHGRRRRGWRPSTGSTASSISAVSPRRSRPRSAAASSRRGRTGSRG